MLEYHLFNGLIYRIFPGQSCSEGDRCLLQIETDYVDPPRQKEEGEDEKEKKEDSPEKTPEELAMEAKNMHGRLSPWTFVISQWKHKNFITELEALLEKKEEEKKEN
jgi:hypothetical protein